MLRSWKIGRAFGIPLFVHPTFLVLLLYVLLQGHELGLFRAMFNVCVILTVFGCVLLHELGHALMARYFGIETRDITLYPIGGVARLDRLNEQPHEELCIALAGPAVNVVIAALLAPLIVLAMVTLPLHGNHVKLADGPLVLLANFGFEVCLLNIVLVVFNLIPAFPMDGGRVLRAILSYWLGQLRATDIAGQVGLVIAMLMAVAAAVYGNWMLLLVSLFVALMGQLERLSVRYREIRRRMVFPSDPMNTWHGFSDTVPDEAYRAHAQWVDGRPIDHHFPTE